MRVGLVAMSGIRVCDAELLRLGLTLPGFVERSKTIASLPSLGLLTLAALTPPPHEAEYIEMPAFRAGDPIPQGFDLIAISSYSAQMNEAYALARACVAARVPVVMGGPHVTALPDEALTHCDSAVLGEGEPFWPQVLADADAGRLKGIYDARPLRYDIAQSPIPAFERLDIAKYNRLTVQTSRGCPHQCEFCASSVLLTDRYKQKPLGNVLAEIDRILTIWPQPFLEFADDNAMVDKLYWRELLRELKKRKLRWFAETDLTVSEDEELLDLMRESGCAQVLVGFESPVEAGLPGIELHGDWKHRMFPYYRDAVRTIQSHGITVNGCFVLGLDGHTTAIFDQVFDFVRAVELYEVQITMLTAFPGTPLYKRLLDERRLLSPKRWEACTLFDVNYTPRGMTAQELAGGFKDLALRLYSDEFTSWRRNTFRRRHARRGRGKGAGA